MDHPSQVFNSESAQEEMRPFIKRMEKLRENTALALEGKDLTEEKVGELRQLLRDLNHDIQLLSGGDTEKTTSVFKWEDNGKNNNDTLPPSKLGQSAP